jgi:hypothetical protein
MGDSHQAAFRILSDFRKGKFGLVSPGEASQVMVMVALFLMSTNTFSLWPMPGECRKAAGTEVGYCGY